MYRIRTDLALETREKYEEDHVEIKGVRLTKEQLEEGMDVSILTIETENGAKLMGRDKGTYITLEATEFDEAALEYQKKLEKHLANLIRKLLEEYQWESVLVVGLGNREVTPDALGPKTVEQLVITRHILKEFGPLVYGERKKSVSALMPGVMAQTGMESMEIIKGVLAETKPDVVIVVDALAARDTRRLNRTIQLTNTGIHPGSGVCNHREPVTKETLEVPVIAIGIPTVVDAATIVADAMHKMGEPELLERIPMANLNTLYVTPKDIDASIERLGQVLAHALNLAFDS